jgi:hypothetical protein
VQGRGTAWLGQQRTVRLEKLIEIILELLVCLLNVLRLLDERGGVLVARLDRFRQRLLQLGNWAQQEHLAALLEGARVIRDFLKLGVRECSMSAPHGASYTRVSEHTAERQQRRERMGGRCTHLASACRVRPRIMSDASSRCASFMAACISAKFSLSFSSSSSCTNSAIIARSREKNYADRDRQGVALGTRAWPPPQQPVGWALWDTPLKKACNGPNC